MFVKKDYSSIVVDVPVRDPEDGITNTFQARWKLHPCEDRDQRIQLIQDGGLPDHKLVEEDLVEVIGIMDDKGKPVPDNDMLRAWLLRWPHTRQALIGSWFQAQAGRAAAAEKN